MVSEEQILRFYLKVFSIFAIFIIYLFYIFFYREISLKNDFFYINKNENYKDIIDNNINDYTVNNFFYKILLRFQYISKTKIHYGKFDLKKNKNFFEILKKIKQPSKYFIKITIIEGWSQNDLDQVLSKFFDDYESIEYNEALADTYFFNQGSSFIAFHENISNKFFRLRDKYKNHYLLKRFSFEEIVIIASLLEKEGINYEDKKKIYSVIINRLNKKMKLQIDASVIYSITKGKKKFQRNLNYSDLKLKDPYNTYVYFGLPPKPISYVSNKTIELIFEDYKTDYLFYFYNSLEGKHIFSLNYKDHLNKLNEYKANK